MRWLKILKSLLLVLVITILLLEISSAILLHIENRSLAAAQENFLFERSNPYGTFEPSPDYVLPVKKMPTFSGASVNLKSMCPPIAKGYGSNSR